MTRHGAPGSGQRNAVRAAQAGIAAAPASAALAGVLARRLDRYPADGGLPSLDPVDADVSAQYGPDRDNPWGTPILGRLLGKAARALEAPPEELVRRKVITSGDVLATVLPQLTSRLTAAGIGDPMQAGLYEQACNAFRRRRGLLLLNLEHQVRFEEPPWVAALAPAGSLRLATPQPPAGRWSRPSVLALTAFPQARCPTLCYAALPSCSSRPGAGHVPGAHHQRRGA